MQRTLLVVDDVAVNREILKKMLGDKYDILEAANGGEALEIIRREKDALSAVLLDLVMPVTDGFEVLRRMRDDTALCRIPVLVTTEMTGTDAELEALSLGAIDYITKPYIPAIIIQRLKNTIALRESSATVNALRRDALTGMLNREAFFGEVERAVAQKEAGYYVLSSFDVDNFKVINDQYGTAMGDSVLKHVSSSINEWAETHGGIGCRVMADNFAILYPRRMMDTPEMEAWHRDAASPACLGRTISIRIGRYFVDDLSLSASAMYDRATLAGLSVKGRYDMNIAAYTESMRDLLLREQLLVNEMNVALAEGQFEVWFQPQYNHSSGALVGAEALIRWRHPERGLIPPSDFVPAFERNGFIYEMDKYVWEQTCRMLQRWLREKRRPLPVSVNISRYDVFRSDFFEVVTGLVESYEIPLDLLRLEITESAFAESSEQIIDMVKRLIEYGFVIEIDDFGSGYSSLNTLKDVPATILKLDMKFLESDSNSQRGGNILESVVRMAKWLGMSVIAEGVETVEQANFLNSIGCIYIQGYLYSGPLVAKDYEKLAGSSIKEEKMKTLETVENLDNDSFWDPKSMDTLIFNSYIGGASIFEYHDGKIEIIRANDKYAKIVGGEDCKAEFALNLVWEDHMDEATKATIKNAFQQAIETGDDVTYEAAYTGFKSGKTYLRTTVRVIARTNDRYLLYNTNENITLQREAEENERRALEQTQAIMDDVGSGITASVYEDGKIKFLFANDKYFEIFGFTREQYDAEVSDIFSLIHPDCRRRIENTADGVFTSGGNAQMEYRVIRRDGEERWVRATLSTTSLTGVDMPVQLCVLSDISQEKDAERNLRETDDQLRFLNETAHDLLAQPDSDKAIEETLYKLLDFFDGDRAYVFELNNASQTACNTYEVCAGKVTPEKDRLQNISYETLSFWLNAFEKDGYVDIADVSALAGSRENERETLAVQGISSLIAVPLMRDGNRIGFIGIDNLKRQHARIDRLAALGDYIAVMLTRRDLNARINSDNSNLLSLMNDTPGGFARLNVDTETGALTPAYFNDGFCKLFGMSRARVTELYGGDATAGVFPDDRDTLLQAISTLLSGSVVPSIKIRMVCGDGAYIWVMVSGRLTTDENKRKFLNIYFTDASEQVKLEQQRAELLDNLPYGAALYEYNGEAITAIHINRRYRELVNRPIIDLSKASVTDAVHPDDRGALIDELKRAISEGRDVDAEARVRYGDGNDYRTFRIVGRIIRGDDKVSVYTAYTPIADDEISYKEMLSTALSAVIGTTNNLSFVKDSKRRYVCCSPPFVTAAGCESDSDMVGKTDFEIFDRETAEKYRVSDDEILSGRKNRVDYESLVPTADNTIRYGKTTKYPLLNAKGSTVGIYSVTRDITDIKASDSQLKLLTDTIPCGLATYTMAPDDIQLTYFNDGICELFGLSREEYAKLGSDGPLGGVFSEDCPELKKQLDALISDGTPVECAYRIHTADGGFKWVKHHGVVVEKQGEKIIVNAMLLDITEERKSIDKLRTSEEEYRLAMSLSGNSIARFDVATRTLTLAESKAAELGQQELLSDLPYGPIKLGVIDPASIRAYTDFYEGIINGSKTGEATFRKKTSLGWRSYTAGYSTIFSESGEPVSAVISFFDATEQIEKEAVFQKWQQSLLDKDPSSYTLFRCNLSKNASFDSMEGTLLSVDFSKGATHFNDRTAEYAEQRVYSEDVEKYCALLNSDALLAGYYRGVRTHTLDYREKLPDEKVRWMRITVELVEYRDTKDVEAFLMFEDIDEEKRTELDTLERADTDPLTGVLNRTAFIAQFEQTVQSSKANACHALFMLDIDGFKLVNDAFGHGAGDRTLVDIAAALHSTLRSGDLIGRFGGDEFVVFIKDIPNDVVAANKARQICAVIRRSFSSAVQISASVGIALCPKDGRDFDTLYKKSDAALYHIKSSGKDDFSFYCNDIADYPEGGREQAQSETKKKKNRMLVVDDDPSSIAIIESIFSDTFLVEKATDGAAALKRLRSYGYGISIVLLDLVMPNIDGFGVLERIKGSSDTQSIPVIAISADASEENCLRAIRCGASEFVQKPIDAELLKVRVHTAINRAENERVRAQNSFLRLQSEEIARYRTVLESTGTIVVEYDWVNESFSYDPDISEYIAGNFDNRPLWQIMTEDKTADEENVKKMQKLVSTAANDQARMRFAVTVKLATPADGMHLFRMGVYKRANELGLSDSLIITFNNLDELNEEI